MIPRKTLRQVLPPVLVEALRRLSGRAIRFAGDYPSWVEARAAATGYDKDEILQRVVDATRQVEAGLGAYERDSVVFAHHAYSFPLLAALLRAAALQGGRLDVLDFGGSLGSTFRQCRPFLEGLAHLSWCVVEQPNFVAVGQREFTTGELCFAGSPQTAPCWGKPYMALLSSVLQYLEQPAQLLDALADSTATSLVIDRTPVSLSPRDRLCVQSVPRHIYNASYPSWIFSRPALLSALERRWRLVAEFECEEGSFSTRDGVPFTFVGLIFERKP